MNFKNTTHLPTEKLQKVLANAGLASRREIEKWISAGRVTVNNVIASLGDRVSIKDQIFLDDQPIKQIKSIATKTRVLLYHKPEGEVCTRHDEKGRKTVFDSLPKLETGRWIMVGRLDLNSSGLLLFTNNGELANQLMHPKYLIEREYMVRVHGLVTEQILENLRNGIELDGTLAKFEKVEKVAGKACNNWYRVIVTEGRNRLIRRLFETQNIAVNRLIRIRFHSIYLPKNLPSRSFVKLDQSTTNKLQLSEF